MCQPGKIGPPASEQQAASASQKESSAPQDSFPFLEKENKQKQSSTAISLELFPDTLQALAEFPAARLADDLIVCDMIRRVLPNTPDASDGEISEFVSHKAREIQKPKTSFMACLSAMVVQALQGHRMVLYRQQRQTERQHREIAKCKEVSTGNFHPPGELSLRNVVAKAVGRH